MTETESEYPSWRTALFGNSHAANLYCAVKYFIWHAAHALLAVPALALFLLVKAYHGLQYVSETISPERTPAVPTPDMNVKEKFTSEKASKAGIWVLLVLLVGWFGYLGYVLVLYILANTVQFLAIVGGIALAIIVLAVGVRAAMFFDNRHNLVERTKGGAKQTTTRTVRTAGVIKEKSKETPLVRRVLGYCPVSMSIEPRWFDAYSELLFGEE